MSLATVHTREERKTAIKEEAVPRVYAKKKSRAGCEYRCSRCGEPIVAGQEYLEWAFRYGGKVRQHASHGSPRQSQLTQSKMATVYAAAEALEDFSPAEFADQDEGEYVRSVRDDATSALEEAISEAQGVADEYREAIDAMPASEEQNQERIDAIEDWISTLEQAQAEVDDVDEDGIAEDGDAGDASDAVERIVGILNDAASEFSY